MGRREQPVCRPAVAPGDIAPDSCPRHIALPRGDGRWSEEDRKG